MTNSKKDVCPICGVTTGSMDVHEWKHALDDVRAERLMTNSKKDSELENTHRLDLYHIVPDELDEIVSRCEGKYIQQVVYSTYHKAFTRICFGCMQVDTTLDRELLNGDKER